MPYPRGHAKRTKHFAQVGAAYTIQKAFRAFKNKKNAKAHISRPLRNTVKSIVKRQAETKFQQATIATTDIQTGGLYTYQPLYYIVQGDGAKDRNGDVISDIYLDIRYNWYAQAGYWNSGGGAEIPHPQGVNVRCMIIRTELVPSVGTSTTFHTETSAGSLMKEFIDPTRVYMSHITPDDTYNTSIVKSRLTHSRAPTPQPTGNHSVAVATLGSMGAGRVTYKIPRFRYVDGSSNQYGSKYQYLVCFIADYANSANVSLDVGTLEVEILTKFKDI